MPRFYFRFTKIYTTLTKSFIQIMVHNFSSEHSLISNWVSELRNVDIQNDRMRFRRNLERIAEVIGYEISKGMETIDAEITTPMGVAKCKVLKDQPVLATILRAGLAMHNGLLSYFDRADNAFLSAYRKHNADGSFDILLEYMSCPPIEGRVVIVSDPMLATGASLVKAIQYIREAGNIKELHVVCAIAAKKGVETLLAAEPNAHIWCGCIDDDLSAKGYIIPGLGDAGDLAYGTKMQQ
jgi:uracil phosphoribosyltransferase